MATTNVTAKSKDQPTANQIFRGLTQTAVAFAYFLIVLEIEIPARPWLWTAFVGTVACLFFILCFKVRTWKGLAPFIAAPVLVFAVVQIWSFFTTTDNVDDIKLTCKLTSGKGSTLIVLVHGAGGVTDTSEVAVALGEEEFQKADLGFLDGELNGTKWESATGVEVLQINYGALAWRLPSNTNPAVVAGAINKCLEQECQGKQFRRIILMGYSMGALLARKTFLIGNAKAESDPEHWANRVKRIVLLAGMNRGWSVAGQRPADMNTLDYLKVWSFSTFGHLTGTAEFGRQMERGAPFVANLRLEWMRNSRMLGKRMPRIIQLLGDIDDIVADEDNMDLRVTATNGFCWLRVHGTGHPEIVKMKRTSDNTPNGDLSAYRFRKLVRAVTEPFATLQIDNEIQQFETDSSVDRVVFVLHGIRDLGRWSAYFEEALAKKDKDRPDRASRRARIVSPRYGYFGMGPFVLRAKRAHFVRWFMDEYTETLAKYPKVTPDKIDFFGHSNGTYLLARGLEDYDQLKINRIVFGGSVVRRRFPWQKCIENGQVKAVRNYVATDDWVVALFPCFFEQTLAYPFGNDLGSAGFNGFIPPSDVPRDTVIGREKKGEPVTTVTGEIVGVDGDTITIKVDDKKVTLVNAAFVQNVGRISGEHSAFMGQIVPIEEFLASSGMPKPVPIVITGTGHSVLQFVSDWFCWAIWLALTTQIAGGCFALVNPELAWSLLKWPSSLPRKVWGWILYFLVLVVWVLFFGLPLLFAPLMTLVSSVWIRATLSLLYIFGVIWLLNVI